MKMLIAKDLKKCLISGSYSIINHRGKIDALNVFPVPDGDTGSNMSGTVQSAIEAIKILEDNNHVGILMHKFARGALMGARGNSGVILSQIFEGFAIALNNKKEINTFDLVKCFQQAKVSAYKSVITPIEGTLLTVIRLVAEDLSESITPSNDILDVFDKAVKSARKACDLTPTILPKLEGRIDSGGEGLWYILKGMLEALKGKPITLEANGKNNNDFIVGFGPEDYDGEFGYCTEGLVELKNKDRFNIEKFKQSLGKVGDSIVVVRNDDIIKVHIHTLNSGTALNTMQKHGDFIKIKVENMTLQANQSKGQKDNLRKESQKKAAQHLNDVELNQKHEEKSLIEVISCNDGRGLIEEMRSLGANTIIEGGQTNNPSNSDFLNAIEKIKAKNIIILPNNPNIIFVAQQIIQTVEDKNIIIIPTKSQVEGITAMLNFDSENSLEENQELMLEGIESMQTGAVTMAIKDTKINGVSIKKGDYLALANRQVIASTKSKTESAIAIVDNLANDDTELITIWYGGNATKLEAKEVAAHIESNYETTFEIKQGNQHIYEFLISFE